MEGINFKEQKKKKKGEAWTFRKDGLNLNYHILLSKQEDFHTISMIFAERIL